jgi:hypothetical protein
MYCILRQPELTLDCRSRARRVRIVPVSFYLRLAVAGLGAVACNDGDPALRTSGPKLSLVGSVELQESDSLYLARPTALVPSAQHGTFVADMFFQRIILFDARGRPVLQIGRKGHGPGEFVDVARLGMLGDSVLFAIDYGTRRLQLFDARTGHFNVGYAYDGKYWSTETWGDTLLLGDMNFARRSVIALWPLGGASVVHYGTLPQSFLASPALASVHSLVSAASLGSGFIVGTSGDDHLVRLSFDGHVVDSARIPSFRRRGTPSDIVKTFSSPRPFPELFASASFLMGMHVRTTGDIILVHFDQDIQGKNISSRIFVSVVSGDLRRACVDAPLEVKADAQPVTAFDGDDLLLLLQRVGTDNHVHSVVERWRIESEGCSWVSTS